jgi:hypothetical protein
MGFGLAAQAERIVAGGRAIEVARMRITEAGGGLVQEIVMKRINRWRIFSQC